MGVKGDDYRIEFSRRLDRADPPSQLDVGSKVVARHQLQQPLQRMGVRIQSPLDEREFEAFRCDSMLPTEAFR